MGKLVLITGATAGIGEATAVIFAANGCDLILTGRRAPRLAKIKKHLESKYKIKVTTLSFDVSSLKECESMVNENKKMLSNLDVLINNAGLAAGIEATQEAHIEDWEVMIDTNIKGLLYMTRLILPMMIKKNSGHIVNLGSVAGRWTYPRGGVYCATKAAVLAITEGIRMDLVGKPIRVTNVSPGMVETEFSLVRLKDAEKAKAVYKQIKPLSAVDVAETIFWCVERPPHVNIQEVIMFPTEQVSAGHVIREAK